MADRKLSNGGKRPWLVVLSLVFGLMSIAPLAHALSGSDFNAGRIMDDTVFTAANSLNATEIQNFLNSKVPVCDTYGTQPINSGSSQTRAQWAAANGKPLPPYICLKDYSENISAKSADAYCGGGIGSGQKTAAQIINDVSKACNISPKVLIVLLQKEQSLVTDDWPWPVQYRSATGYGCPDTAACDSTYYGFFNQVYNAARVFQYYAKNQYGYRPSRNNSIWYSPDHNCGASDVFIQNQATAGLYNYTPYQPNAAALNNLYGSGDSCSAYGNRNFWRLYNDWFGSTLANEANYVRHIKKMTFGSRQQLYTSTDTQLYVNAWGDGLNGVQRSLVAKAPFGERIVDFDVINEPNTNLQSVYLATIAGIYKTQWNGTSYSTLTKIITQANVLHVVANYKVESAPTYRLYVLADDGPYEYWWRDGTSISNGFRFWNIDHGVAIVKSTDPSGADELYVATGGAVLSMRWPVSGGTDNIERKLVTQIPNTIAIQKQTLSDSTELLYTANKNGVYETWWKPGTSYSNPAKIVSAPSGQTVVAIKKTMINGYQQLYVADSGQVMEYWWAPGSSIHGGQLIRITQNSISDIDKTSTGSIQNLYTAYQSFVFETWWGDGQLHNGPAIVNLNN